MTANRSLFPSYKIVIAALLCFQAFFAGAQGLVFSSNDSLIAKRTSYVVFNKQAPVLKGNVHVSFDLLLWDINHLGYVFMAADDENSYSLSYLNTDNTYTLNLNIDRVSNKLKIPLNDDLIKKRKWIKVDVGFDLEHNTVNLCIDGKCYKSGGFPFNHQLNGNITFGKNQYYTEVPNMAIKNVRISDESATYTFPLNEWKGNVTHNDAGDATGRVENPKWLINDSYFWRPLYQHHFNQVAGVNFDEANERLVMYKKDSVLFYNVRTSQQYMQVSQNCLPVPMLLGKSIINTRQNTLNVYEPFDIRDGKPTIATLNLQTLKWETVGRALLPTQRHHHNVFYNTAQDTMFLFGGYGSFKYHKSFFKYDGTADKWVEAEFKGDKINPRFFSAGGYTGKPDEVYIFGGYGNESGSQVIGGKQFYDLYRVNLKTHIINKCWNIKAQRDTFVPANNLILSHDKKYFYALCYPHEVFKTSLKLYRFSVKDGSHEVVSAPIPVTSEKIETDINLFYNSKADAFYCVIQEFTDPNNSTVRVFALTGTPVSQAQYLQANALKKKYPTALQYVLTAAGILLLLLLGWLVKRRSNKYKAINTPAEEIPSSPQSGQVYQMQKNAVYLLGEFIVFDKNKRDITYLFSPKIKQLFLLILLHSNNGKGIGAKKISAAMWPDKDLAKTKNLRGVTFNHLRSAISDLEGIQLQFVNDCYLFIIDDNFFCDYLTILHDAHQLTASADIFDEKSYHLLTRGSLLPDAADTWLDDYKRQYDDLLMDTLRPQLQKLYAEKNFKQLLVISKLILMIDPFNDDAFKYELKGIKHLKGIEQARKFYDHFTHEYQRSLGEDYALPFDKLLH